MSGIDERVVGMRFDNKQFESGVSTSLTSIQALKDSLKMDGATKGLDEVAAKAKGFSLGHISDGIDTLVGKFSALSVAGIAALASLTTKAVDAGLSFAKSLTIAPIMDGFSEYELKMGSIQTILANTEKDGTKLKDVTKSLDELNHYADKTIYNFGDMTKNIGLFTNAGLSLKSSTSMIKGFSNAAAASGTSAESAAHAAQQLSQGLSVGTIKAQDWLSLTNAGMGNKNMQTSLIQIAEKMGTFNKKTTDASTASKDFKGSLEKGWLSADVMSKYLKIMSGDMSDAKIKSLGFTKAQVKGFRQQQQTAEDAATKVRTWSQLVGTLKEAVGSSWTDSFELVIGNFDTATKLFTGISNTVGGAIGAMGDARNKMLKGWAKLGGRKDLLDIGRNIYTSIQNIIKPMQDAWNKIFPPDGGKGLKQFTGMIKTFSERIRMLTQPMAKLTPVFEALFGVFKIGMSIIKGVASVFLNMFGVIGGTGTAGIFGLIGGVAALVAEFVEWVNQGQYIAKFFEQIRTYQTAIIQPLVKFVGMLSDAFQLLVQGDTKGFFDGVKNSFSAFAPLIDMISSKMGILGAWFQSVGSVASDMGAKASGPLAAIGSALATAGSYLANFFGSLSGAGDKLVSTFSAVKSAAGSVGDGMGAVADQGSKVTQIWDGIASAFSTVGQWLKPVIDGLGSFFGWVGGKIKSFIDDLSGQDALALINTGLFMAAYLAVKKFMDSFRSLFDGAAGTFGAITESIEGLTGVFGGMQQNLKADSLQKIGIALGIMAGALWVLSTIDAGDLAKATLAIGALLQMLMVTMDAFVDSVKDTEVAKMVALGIALQLVGGAVLALSAALAIFGNMDTDTLTKGTLAIAAVLGILTGALYGMSKAGPLTVQTAASLAILAVALNLLATSILIYAAIPFDKVIEGLGKMGLVLVIIGTAMKAMPEKAMLKNSVALGILAVSLQLLATAILTFSAMSPETVANGLIAIGASLVVLAGGLTLMNGTMMGVVALAAAAAALYLLVPTLVVLGNMDIKTIAIALGALVAIFLVFAGMAVLLTPVIPVMLALAVAIGLLGVGMLAAGAGMMLFASGLALLATVGVAGAAGITAVIMAVLNILPLIIQQVGLALVALAKIVKETAPLIVEAIVVLITELIKGLRKLLPLIIDFVYDMITALADRIHDFIPDIVELAMEMIQALLDGFNEKLPGIIDSAGTLIVAFLDGLNEWIPQIIEAGGELILNILAGLQEKVPEIVTAAGELIVSFLEGLEEQAEDIITAGTDLVISIIEGIGNAATDIADAALDTLVAFLEGLEASIRENTPRINEAGRGIARAIIDGIKNGVTGMAGDAIEAIKGVGTSMLNGIKGIFDIHSPSKKMKEIGQYVMKGLYKGLTGGDADDVKNVFKQMHEGLRDLVLSTRKDVDDAEKTLKKLTEARKKDAKAIEKAEKALKKAKNENKDATDALKKWNKSLDDERKALLKATKEHDKWARDMDEAKQKLADAKQALRDYRAEIKAQYSQLPDFMGGKTMTAAVDKAQAKYDQVSQKASDAATALEAANQKMIDSATAIREQYDDLPDITEDTTVENYIQSLKDDYAAVIKFQKTLTALRSIGLDDETYEQLLEKGTSMQDFADQLLSGGPAAVQEIDKLNDQLNAAAAGLGSQVSQELYQQGVDAAKAIADGVAKELQDANKGLSAANANIVGSYVADLKAQYAATKKYRDDLATLRKRGLNDATYEKLLEDGVDQQGFVTALLAAGQSGVNQVNDATKDLQSASSSLAKAASKELYQAGIDVANGVVKGLKDSEKDITDEMERIAKKMVKAIKKELGIKSPSRAFMEVAGYSTAGLVVGFKKTTGAVETAAANVGSASMEALKKSLSDSASLVSADMDMEPVIRPVLDLSSIQKDSGLINDLIAPKPLTVEQSFSKASSIALDRQNAQQIDADNQVAAYSEPQAPIQFIQNNTSPKALSQAEIYRQTNNQLSTIKGGRRI